MLFVLGLFFKRILPLALLAAIVGGGIWAWREAHASVPSSCPTALDDVRDTTAAPGRQVLPLTGVYSYSATGEEVLSVGPLEITRKLPEEALLVVLPEHARRAAARLALRPRFQRDAAARQPGGGSTSSTARRRSAYAASRASTAARRSPRSGGRSGPGPA